MKTTDYFGLPGQGDAMPEAVPAEQAVIGALLRDNGGVDRMGALLPAQFLRADHRLIFAEVMRQIVAGKGCDVISVGMALADKVDDATAYLNAMAQSCPSAANIARYADLVRDHALRRMLLPASGARHRQRPSRNGGDEGFLQGRRGRPGEAYRQHGARPSL